MSDLNEMQYEWINEKYLRTYVEVINIAGYRNAGNESRFTILTQWAMPKRNHIFLVKIIIGE